MAKEYAKVAWSPNDVMDVAELKGDVMTEEEAIDFLERNSRQIQDDMVERGWESITTLYETDMSN